MKFSIITPSYNSADFLEETIRSIKNQTHSEIEHIIMDGGSTDETDAILSRYSHLTWRSESDAGQSDAINKGFRMATGEVLAWQNADDLYFPDTFERVAHFFQANPGIDVVYGAYQMIDAGGSIICNIRSVDWSEWLFSHGRFVPMQPTAFWRRRVYEHVGDLDASLQYCMDVDFFSRAAQRHRFFRIPALLGKFRVHRKSKTHSHRNDREIITEHRKVLADHFNFGPLDHALFTAFRYRSKWAQFYKHQISPALSSFRRYF